MKTFVAFKQALEASLSSVRTVGTETLVLKEAAGRVLAADLASLVDCPSTSTSGVDGYAVRSGDLDGASPKTPVALKVAGRAAAAMPFDKALRSGECVRLTTGAPLPDGADAVVAEEHCQERRQLVICSRAARPGSHVLERGRDVRKAQTTARCGATLVPAVLGLVAAAGHVQVPVYRLPQVTVIAAGDEVVLPGTPLSPGKLYASNLVEISAWLTCFGLPFRTERVPDRKETIRDVLQRYLPVTDVFLTCGGAWGSEKDLVLDAAQSLKWEGLYHRVRMYPGKPTGYGLLAGKPLFLLPGSPPANEMAFLQLALPTMMKMSGAPTGVFPLVTAGLAESVCGGSEGTHFIHARIQRDKSGFSALPLRMKSRIQSMAWKNAIIVLPEGCSRLAKGQRTHLQLMTPYLVEEP
jgi:molybdopterin molybdotransferase